MVASRESAVRACPCPNSPSSAAWNRPEPASSRRCSPGPARAVAPSQQRDAGLALAHLGQVENPADPVVVHVPQPGEDPAGRQHAGDLGHRAVHVKPVHGLAGQDGVDAGIGQRNLFRAPRHRTHLGQRPPQLRQHLRVRFHRGHVGAEADQRRGQLARSGADVGHPDRPAVPDRLQRPPDRGLGIVGTVLRVGGRGRAERRAVPQPVLRLGLDPMAPLARWPPWLPVGFDSVWSFTRASLTSRVPGVINGPGRLDLGQVAVRPGDKLADGVE